MSNNKLVSIITPCFNGEFLIHRLLDSILNQTYNNIEFIFINDGSTDKTEEVVKSYMPSLNLQVFLLFMCINRMKGKLLH